MGSKAGTIPSFMELQMTTALLSMINAPEGQTREMMLLGEELQQGAGSGPSPVDPGAETRLEDQREGQCA